MSKIVVIGDLMLDIFSYGDVKRLNPESPAPLLNISKEEYKLGGAANVAANIASLNNGVAMIGIIGNDNYGKKIEEICKEKLISLYPLVGVYETITKRRFIENTYKQQLLRVDYEQIYPKDDRYGKEITSYLENIKPEYIVISDYNKGIINKYTISHIKDYANKNQIKILGDIKPLNANLFEGAYILKPNFKEFCEIIKQTIPNEEDEIITHGANFVKNMKANLIVTRGSKGAILLRTDGTSLSIPTEAQQVFDVTGAGDTFIAGLAWALSMGYSLEQSIKIGNKAAGIVIGKVGTAIITAKELNI